MRMARVLVIAIPWLGGCGDTGRALFTTPLVARGTAPRDVAVAGGAVRLREAAVGFGPLYLCATESAESELCETALAEWRDVAVVDALSDEVQGLGELVASTGAVRSAFLDYGISWTLTEQRPRARVLSGHSARLVFEVVPDAAPALVVHADIDILPLVPGDAAVNALRTRGELGPRRAPSVVLDPSAWLRRVRIDDLVALDDDGDGLVRLPTNAQAYEAIVQGMTVNAPPQLVWD